MLLVIKRENETKNSKESSTVKCSKVYFTNLSQHQLQGGKATVFYSPGYYVDITAEQQADFLLYSQLSLTASQLTCIIYTFSYSLLVYVTTSLLEFQPEHTFLKPNTVKNGAATISVARATSKWSRMSLLSKIENISTHADFPRADLHLPGACTVRVFKMEASLDEEGDSRGMAFSAIYHL